MDLILYFELCWVLVSLCYYVICSVVLASGNADIYGLLLHFRPTFSISMSLWGKIKVRLFERYRLEL